MKRDISRLQARLDSQSERIKSMQRKLALIISNHKYYVKNRLPRVLANEKKKTEFCKALASAKSILKQYGHPTMMRLSTKKLNKNSRRYIGYFTHVEMHRLRNLLSKNLKQYIVFNKKNKRAMMLTQNEQSRIKFVLKNSTGLCRIAKER